MPNFFCSCLSQQQVKATRMVAFASLLVLCVAKPIQAKELVSLTLKSGGLESGEWVGETETHVWLKNSGEMSEILFSVPKDSIIDKQSLNQIPAPSSRASLGSLLRFYHAETAAELAHRFLFGDEPIAPEL